MPLITEFHDSLPFIEAELPSTARIQAENLIAAEVSTNGAQKLHPLIAQDREPTFRPIIEAEHSRIAGGVQKMEGGVNLSRYEDVEAPDANDGAADAMDQWRDTLRKAYSNAEFLSERLRSLGLLEQFGKNAWLIGNEQVQDELRALERQLTAVKAEAETVDEQRRAAQVAVSGELSALEETWRNGVGRIIETEIAAEQLRRQILEMKGNMANQT